MTVTTLFLLLAVVLGWSRVFGLTAKLWNKVPSQVRIFGPAVVSLVPFVLGLVGLIPAVGVLHAILVAAALLAPGLNEHIGEVDLPG